MKWQILNQVRIFQNLTLNLSSKYLWSELTWPEAEQRLSNMDVAILPTGAIEQHGPHLPLDVDAFDAEYLAKKVAEACSDPKPLGTSTNSLWCFLSS